MTCANCGHTMAAHQEDSAERLSEIASQRLGSALFPLANCLVYHDAPYVSFAYQSKQFRQDRSQKETRPAWKPYRMPQMRG